MGYTTVTEVPGNHVSREAIDMVCTRYAFAGQYCEGKSVLEIACGPGPGLGHLSARARKLVGGDFTEGLLRHARDHYGSRVPLVRFDAHALPFRSGAFDVIVIFEAIYFMADADRVLESCHAALAPGGLVILATANPGRPDFNPSPQSTRYFTGSQLVALLGAHGFEPELYGGFPLEADGAAGRLLRVLKRVAVALHLIPKTMAGKELLKRLVFGKLVEFPAEVTGSTGTCSAPALVENPAAASGYKVLYAVARRAA